MLDPKPLRRDQLSKFLPDEETIRRFERLFQKAGQETPNDLIGIGIEASSALALANLALNELDSLKDYFENNLNGLDLDFVLSEIENLKSNVSPSLQQMESLTDLSDTKISAPSNGQVLKYNSSIMAWVNGAGGGNSDVGVIDGGTPSSITTGGVFKIDFGGVV